MSKKDGSSDSPSFFKPAAVTVLDFSHIMDIKIEFTQLFLFVWLSYLSKNGRIPAW